MVDFDIVIVGAGINGLATAYQLTHEKGIKIGIIEQFSVGHTKGSSHGLSRIFRSTYLNPVYTQLARIALLKEWPALEKTAGHNLLYPNPRCIFGSGPDYESIIEAALKSHSQQEVQLLGVIEARNRFPQFKFLDPSPVLLDHTSQVIAAEKTILALERLIRTRNVPIYENTEVLEIHSHSNGIALETTKGVFRSARVILTVGPWIRQVSEKFNPIQQIVGYYSLKGPMENYQIGLFPNWVYYGKDIFYGLPEFGCKGIKIAQDVTSGKPSQENTLEPFIGRHFVEPIVQVEKIEHCFYTMTPTQDFVIDFLSRDPRILIGSACSGHAFKFAPLTGKILSQLALEGKTTIEAFERNRALFSLARL